MPKLADPGGSACNTSPPCRPMDQGGGRWSTGDTHSARRAPTRGHKSWLCPREVPVPWSPDLGHRGRPHRLRRRTEDDFHQVGSGTRSRATYRRHHIAHWVGYPGDPPTSLLRLDRREAMRKALGPSAIQRTRWSSPRQRLGLRRKKPPSHPLRARQVSSTNPLSPPPTGRCIAFDR